MTAHPLLAQVLAPALERVMPLDIIQPGRPEAAAQMVSAAVVHEIPERTRDALTAGLLLDEVAGLLPGQFLSISFSRGIWEVGGVIAISAGPTLLIALQALLAQLREDR